MPWAAVAAAGVAAVSSAQNRSGAHKMNKRQVELAREQMRFQERMSSTAHQRETKDLEAAGLNRILGLGGGGASSPGGAMPVLANEGAAGTEGAVRGAASAIAIIRQKQELRNMKAQEGETRAKRDTQKIVKLEHMMRIGLIRKQTAALSGAAAISEKVGGVVNAVTGPAKSGMGRIADGEMEWKGMADQVLRDIGELVSPAKSAWGNLELPGNYAKYKRETKGKDISYVDWKKGQKR